MTMFFGTITGLTIGADVDCEDMVGVTITTLAAGVGAVVAVGYSV